MELLPLESSIFPLIFIVLLSCVWVNSLPEDSSVLNSTEGPEPLERFRILAPELPFRSRAVIRMLMFRSRSLVSMVMVKSSVFAL